VIIPWRRLQSNSRGLSSGLARIAISLIPAEPRLEERLEFRAASGEPENGFCQVGMMSE
jgi:hypothetical protein